VESDVRSGDEGKTQTREAEMILTLFDRFFVSALIVLAIGLGAYFFAIALDFVGTASGL
jgi:hypothetical protein